MKLQWFPFAEQRGLFVGLDTSLSRLQIERHGSDLAANQTQIGAGVQAGYRLALPAGVYATAWIGVGYAFGADAVTLGGATFEPSALLVFPAVHLGYRFR